MAAVWAALGAMAAVVSIIGIIMWVLLVVANWKIFEKAGEGGWKSIIPIYSTYILFKISWETKFFWITLACSVVAGIGLGLAQSSDGSALWLILYIAALIVAFVIGVIQLSKESAAFGHGAGYTLGLIFLPNVFTLILGFGSDRYLGPQ